MTGSKTTGSTFILSDQVIFETLMYNFIIPKNTVLEFSDKKYNIIRTVFDIERNNVDYFLRKMSSKNNSVAENTNDRDSITAA